jgi:hypothetical protein
LFDEFIRALEVIPAITLCVVHSLRRSLAISRSVDQAVGSRADSAIPLAAGGAVLGAAWRTVGA